MHEEFHYFNACELTPPTSDHYKILNQLSEVNFKRDRSNPHFKRTSEIIHFSKNSFIILKILNCRMNKSQLCVPHFQFFISAFIPPCYACWMRT